jgi:hypothetical protein
MDRFYCPTHWSNLSAHFIRSHKDVYSLYAVRNEVEYKMPINAQCIKCCIMTYILIFPYSIAEGGGNCVSMYSMLGNWKKTYLFHMFLSAFSCLSRLTNSALVRVYEPKCDGEGGLRFAGSQPMSTAVHRSPNKLWSSNSVFSSIPTPALFSFPPPPVPLYPSLTLPLS